MRFYRRARVATVREQILRFAQDDKSKSEAQSAPFQATVVISLAAREVSQRGGGARRGSGAPERMSPKGEIPAQARSDVWSGKRGSNPRHPPWQGGALPLSYSRSGARRIAEGSAAVKLRECLARCRRSAGTRGCSRRRTSSLERIFRREAVRSRGSGRRRPARCGSGSRQAAGRSGPWPG